MSIDPNHWAWQRDRPEHHAGAFRTYYDDYDEDYSDNDHLPRGPDASPRICKLCQPVLEYDSASPDSTTWYLSSSSESSPDLTNSQRNRSLRLVRSYKKFNMSGGFDVLWSHTLTENPSLYNN